MNSPTLVLRTIRAVACSARTTQRIPRKHLLEVLEEIERLAHECLANNANRPRDGQHGTEEKS